MNDPGAQGTPTSTDTSATIKVQAKFVDVTGGAKYAGVAAGRRKLLSSAAAATMRRTSATQPVAIGTARNPLCAAAAAILRRLS